MTSTVIKTFIIYTILLIAMRILGKRQLGELEVSELITTILLSEIAAFPLTDAEASIFNAVVPISIIVALEIVFSFIGSRFPTARRLVSSPPSTLIKDGVINQKELRKNRIAIEELIAELRLNGVFDIDDVKYAILEQNGLLSVIPKAERQQPGFSDFKIKAKEHGIQHIIISQGTWNEYNINLLGRSKLYFQEYLKKHHVSEKSVFLLTIDDLNHCTLVLKEAE